VIDAAIPGKFGRFRVLSSLGQGAMGMVYRAEDPLLGRIVAIKTIALAGNAEERDEHEARFLQEARAAGSVSHPAVITIHDVGREGDTAFMAMELLEGRELRELIRDDVLEAPRAMTLVAMIADGLAAAHERGVIHRDIKPGNIMVLPDGRVKIMDFGIARLRESTLKTQTGMVLGSPQYMSPEQIAGRGVDHRSDIFSLGVVLYEALTRAKPFSGADMAQLFFAISNTAVQPVTQRTPGLPSVIDYILARAMKKSPEERYASAAELASDLRDCAAQMAQAPVEFTATQPAALKTQQSPEGFRISSRFPSAKALARLPSGPPANDT
jgi:serine/threonine-protein kinase